MIKDKIEKEIRFHKEIEGNEPQNDIKIQWCWENELKILESNLEETIEFFKKDCTFEELYWLSEIFEELVYDTQSKKLWEAIEIAFNKYKDKYPEKDVDSIKMDMDYAKGYFK